MKKLCIFIFLAAVTQACSAQIETFPAFESCSIYLKIENPDSKWSSAFKEKKNEAWNRAYPPVIDKEKKEVRFSIVNLKENTEYELKLENKNTGEIKKTEFKTLTLNVPIAKTVLLDEHSLKNGLVIKEKGTPEGWIRYMGKPASLLKCEQGAQGAITLKNAEYIILENLTIQGGDRSAIDLQYSQNIRIINCDISRWGRIGVQDMQRDGNYYVGKKRVNYDPGINIFKSGNILIERCYIHDPRGRSNSWAYEHPAGPEAIYVLSTGGVVIRYNDFIGSDQHRWNDVIEGNNNRVGGFYRDADIYGNMLAFANDDGVELEGGEMNVRFHHNRIEGALCGISTGRCNFGPAYIYRNLIENLSDEDGIIGAPFKNGHGIYGKGRLFFFNNTSFSPNAAYGGYNRNPPEDGIIKAVTRNNIFVARKIFDKLVFKSKNDFDFDLLYSKKTNYLEGLKKEMKTLGQEANGIFANPDFVNPESGFFNLKKTSPAIDNGTFIPNFTEKCKGNKPDIGAFEYASGMVLPLRPIPLFMDKFRLHFKAAQNKKAPPAQIVTIENKGSSPLSFEIKKNFVFDWFEVSPKKATLNPGQKLKLSVSMKPENFKRPGVYRGAFLTRLGNGFSRIAMVYAIVDGNKNIKPKKEKGFACYIEAENFINDSEFKIIENSGASGGKALEIGKERKNKPEGPSAKYEFKIPKDGLYRFRLRVTAQEKPAATHDSCFLSIDGSEPERCSLRNSSDCWIWSNAARVPKRFFELIKLKKGTHTIEIYTRETFLLDMIAVYDEEPDSWH